MTVGDNLPEITADVLDQWEQSALADHAAGRQWSVSPLAVLAVVKELRRSRVASETLPGDARYALHALLGISNGRSKEATIECGDLDDALTRLRQAVEHRPDFVAISLLHIEDLPKSLEGAAQVGG